MQTRSCGGSALTEDTAVTVSPWRPPGVDVVTTVTAAGTWRIAER